MAEGGWEPRRRNGEESRQQQVCRFYLHNNCAKGDRCSYRHVRERFPEKEIVCRFYQQGNCTYGRNCKFAHTKSNKHREDPPRQTVDQKLSAGHGGGSRQNVKVKEFPSNFVSLKKSNSDRNVRDSEAKKGKDWVQAQDFVPGKRYHGSVPSSYASAVQPHRLTGTNATSDLPSSIKENMLLCPYFEQTGYCQFEHKCKYAHAFICEFCGMPKLHPTDQEQREKHIKECIEEHERQMEHAFAVQGSEDKECGICLENVMEKEQGTGSAKRFGILENCNHCFCLSCIRMWRQNKSDIIQTQRTCPTCRTHSDFVTPSKFWVESPRAKKKLIDDYKIGMSTRNCQYFKRGKGECPFDDRCFYKHAMEDGTVVHQNVIRRRRRVNAEGEREAEDGYSLWDFISRREEDGQSLPLDAQLSLVLLGLFQDSDDEDEDNNDDNNNNFRWRYNFLSDLLFTDSDTDSDSD